MELSSICWEGDESWYIGLSCINWDEGKSWYGVYCISWGGEES